MKDYAQSKSNVSVIIPCYRCNDTILRAIDSVINQTWMPQEVILIDDYSNDDGKTLNLLHKIASDHQQINIRIIALDHNLGPGNARNVGWQEASQAYIAFLDADDAWHPRKLEIQFSWMLEHPNVLMSGHLSAKLNLDSFLPEVPKHIYAFAMTKWRLLLSNQFPTRSVMLRRDIQRRFVAEKRYAEDYLLWLTIFFDKPTWFIKIPLAFSFKGDYGDAGLTANLWASELGELDTYKRIYSSGLINFPEFVLTFCFSIFKFMRRLIIVGYRLLTSRNK